MRCGRHRPDRRRPVDLPPCGAAAGQDGPVQRPVLRVRRCSVALLDAAPFRSRPLSPDRYGQRLGRRARSRRRHGPGHCGASNHAAALRRRECAASGRELDRPPGTGRRVQRLLAADRSGRGLLHDRGGGWQRRHPEQGHQCRPDCQARLPARHPDGPPRLHRGGSHQDHGRGQLLRGNAGSGRSASDQWLRRSERRHRRQWNGNPSNDRKGRWPGGPAPDHRRGQPGARRGRRDHRGESRVRRVPKQPERRCHGPDRGWPRPGERQRPPCRRQPTRVGDHRRPTDLGARSERCRRSRRDCDGSVR